jgi:FMN-dependent NADH-azoreductase
MYFVRKYTAILLFQVAVSLLIVSCGSNKIAECNRILEIGNKHSPKTEKNSENLDAKQLLIQAYQAEQKAKEMEALGIGDENLKAYKARFVKAYKEESKALRNAAIATEDAAQVANKNDTSSINASLKATDMYLKVTQVYSQQLTILNELTTYCTK